MNQNNKKIPVKIGDLDFLCLKRASANKAVIMLHGYGANWEDLFPLGQELDPEGQFDWYFPNAPLEVPLGFMMSGRAWFPINAQELEAAMARGEWRSFGEAVPETFEKVLANTTASIKIIEQDYEEIILGGFSQGAMMCSHLLFGLQKVAGLVLFSGNLLAKEFFKNKSTKSIEFFQSHGDEDPILGFAGAQELFEQLESKGLKGDFVRFNGGHTISWDVIKRAQNFLAKFY
ncbi:MAG: hypothetical protein JNM93_02840 [Bacteriovoracaceae bacterium]|nr:hypothetical protein [Bacteriovoracaceae bacterium]